MQKLTIIAVAAAVTLVAVPVAGAAEKVDTKVAWTDYDDSFDPVDKPEKPLIHGEVTSDSKQCLKKRRVVISGNGNAQVKTKTSRKGKFDINWNDFTSIVAFEMPTQVKQAEAGGKTCRSDTATFSLVSDQPQINNFQFDDSTNTFFGTITSNYEICRKNRVLEIIKFDNGATTLGATTANASGAFSYTHPSHPGSAYYEALYPQQGGAEFLPNGDGRFVSCSQFSSNGVDL